MPTRIVTGSLAILVALTFTACAPPRSEAEQTYREWMRAVDDVRRGTVTEGTAETLRGSSSTEIMRALQSHLSEYVDRGYRQTGYRHVVAFRFVHASPAVGPARADTRITADVCVDASLTGQVDADGEPLDLTPPLRYARLVEFAADASGRLRVNEDAKSYSDICE